MGDKTEEVFVNTDNYNNLIINVRQQVALYLDQRLKRRAAVMDSEGWKESKHHFENEHVKFYTHMKLYDMKLKKEQQKRKNYLAKPLKLIVLKVTKTMSFLKLGA